MEIGRILRYCLEKTEETDVIEIGKITYAYKGRTVLKDASFKVNNGKIYGIFGLKNAGKSTLLSLMAGARETQDGVIRINGFDMKKEPVSAKKCVGYCPQSTVFYPSMTVYELLDFVAAAKAVREDRKFIAVHELMEAYALEDLRDRRISRLTPAQMFRLKLTQALVGGSEIILLDSPTEGLSFSDAKEARELIRGLAEKGKTVFLATASAEEVLALADEFMLLRNGSLSTPVPTNELLTGGDLLVRVMGEKNAVLELLSKIDGLISCQPLAKSEDGVLNFRVRSQGKDDAQAIEELLRANGLEASVSEEPLDETERALRTASGQGEQHRNDQTEEKEEEV